MRKDIPKDTCVCDMRIKSEQFPNKHGTSLNTIWMPIICLSYSYKSHTDVHIHSNIKCTFLCGLKYIFVKNTILKYEFGLIDHGRWAIQSLHYPLHGTPSWELSNSVPRVTCSVYMNTDTLNIKNQCTRYYIYLSLSGPRIARSKCPSIHDQT